MADHPERYLGDGVTASFDGYHVTLDLRGQDDSRIALDPEVLERLFTFSAACWKRQADAARDGDRPTPILVRDAVLAGAQEAYRDAGDALALALEMEDVRRLTEQLRQAAAGPNAAIVQRAIDRLRAGDA